MKFIVNGKAIHAHFFHLPSKGSVKGSTLCTLHHGACDRTGTSHICQAPAFSVRRTTLHPRDQYSYAIGRKTSLTYALKGTLTKDERRVIWTQYFQQHPYQQPNQTHAMRAALSDLVALVEDIVGATHALPLLKTPAYQTAVRLTQRRRTS